MPKIYRLLIANRGEIAVRIMRACREAGIVPIAVYSEADRDSLHVSLADVAYCIGPAAATESYRNIGAILDAARHAQADALHPGYGFLSENAEFAQACEEAGILFVGPPAEVIRRLGDKIAAKQRMAAVGIPVVPGYHGKEQSEDRLLEEALRIGSPLLIKAAAGGGGRGMRIVEEVQDFPGLLDEARREAKAAFGDDRVLLERYIRRPRHVEFQIFGDTQGNVISLFERECSLQRRHQKIVEESPSPVLTPELRARMAESAVTVGTTAGYVNAGTVEFLVEPNGEGDASFYFLEVNTRLQVEHPVTEERTGIDLVRLQFRIAEGETLPLTQAQVTGSGHAIEVRLYAEDAASGFLPSVGRLVRWTEPTGPGVRVDSGVTTGSEVSPYYDPMLAKLIVSAGTRDAALARLEQALLHFHVLGVQTNLSYLLAIVRHPRFRAGDLSTAFLAEEFAGWHPNDLVPPEVLFALAAEMTGKAFTQPADNAVSAPSDVDANSPWRQREGWRNT